MIGYSVYQIANMKDSRYGFRDWEFAESHGFTINDYVCTYSGKNITYSNGRECKYPFAALEILFEMFNAHRPEDFTGHSLSVSDVVELIVDDKSEYYYCDSFGWEKLPEKLVA